MLYIVLLTLASNRHLFTRASITAFQQLKLNVLEKDEFFKICDRIIAPKLF